MRVTLDLTDLVAKGAITKAEADRLADFALRETGSLAVNILLSFGTVAIALGAGFLLPTAETVIVIGAILFLIGLGLILNRAVKWTLFAQICTTVGALGIVGGVTFLSNGDIAVNFALAVGLAIAAAVAASGLLAAMSILQLAVALGSGTAYWHATYGLWVERPALSVVVLSVVTLALFFASMRLPPAYERIAIIGARTAILMINLAFLVGSLFGDQMLHWPASVFSIVWAVLLIGVGLWAVRANRRWVVNAAAIFGALHFYTQWFEYLGPSPLAILLGGILLIAFGLGLRWFNQQMPKEPPAPAAPQSSVSSA